ncbi:MAG: polymerase subunit epsilon, partial [Subtercola sp.]|nr:polymerase subunit epsilon [Subtercola sp.]
MTSPEHSVPLALFDLEPAEVLPHGRHVLNDRPQVPLVRGGSPALSQDARGGVASTASATATVLLAPPLPDWPVWAHRLAVFDLETTGIDVETARIVTAHVGLIDSTGESIAHGEWLADPGVEIPSQASAVHGITTERAQAEGRPAPEVIAEIIAALRAVFTRGVPLV